MFAKLRALVQGLLSGEAPEPEGERRATIRVPLEMRVEIGFDTMEEFLRSATVDLSSDGAFLRMPQPRPEGTRVKLILHVEDYIIDVQGVVVRTVEPGQGPITGVGVFFTEVEASTQDSLDALVRASDDRKDARVKRH